MAAVACNWCGSFYEKVNPSRFCGEDCRIAYRRAYAKAWHLANYEANKERNRRNMANSRARRFIMVAVACAWCGSFYEKTTASLCCSEDCRKQRRNANARARVSEGGEERREYDRKRRRDWYAKNRAKTPPKAEGE